MIAGIIAWAAIAVVILFVWLGKKMMDKAARDVPVYGEQADRIREMQRVDKYYRFNRSYYRHHGI